MSRKKGTLIHLGRTHAADRRALIANGFKFTKISPDRWNCECPLGFSVTRCDRERMIDVYAEDSTPFMTISISYDCDGRMTKWHTETVFDYWSIPK